MSKGRVLLSGFTIQHVGRDPRLKYDHLTKMYAAALTRYGYEVEHREIVPEEDISGYDALLIGLGPINGTTTRYQYGAFDALARAKDNNVAVLFYCDDWQIQLVASSVSTFVRQPDRMVKDFFKGARVHWDWARENLDHIFAPVQRMHDEKWPTTILPLYDGGDHAKLLQRGKPRIHGDVVGVDPSSYAIDYRPNVPDSHDKWGAWVLGTLSNQQDWVDKLQLSWPLAYHGARASKSERGALKESDLVQLYAESWGVLSPPYWHNGAGWWRLRHQHAIQAQSVLLTDNNELGFMGDAYKIKASEVESMNISTLVGLAAAQREAFTAQMWSREKFETTLGDTVAREIKDPSW